MNKYNYDWYSRKGTNKNIGVNRKKENEYD